MREVLGLNLSKRQRLLTKVFHGFSQSFQENAGIVPIPQDGVFTNRIQLSFMNHPRQYTAHLLTVSTYKQNTVQ
jgi:hypothetical protein